MPAMMLYVTSPNREEALRLAETLVEERLIACGNVIDGMESVYRWNGKVEHAREAILIAKTDRRNIELVTARILELHSYGTPAVVAVPIEGGSADYLTWVENQSTAFDDGLAG
jgi:periplasmic divalent cation tolerance protein